MVELDAHQLDAIEKLKNGSILVGGTGSGKSRTALAYYYLKACQGQLRINGKGTHGAAKAPRDLYIITTAQKRDTGDWLDEAIPFCIKSPIVVDSWNNIQKYKNVTGAFFIFDEQRIKGKGPWAKTFIRIARRNQWILLSATPGDKWEDYMSVFIANGFYKDFTDFRQTHLVYAPFRNYPKVVGYFDKGLLIKHRRDIIVCMPLKRTTVPHKEWITCSYNRQLYLTVLKNRWNPFDNCPIEETGKLFYLLRKVVNEDQSRVAAVKKIFKKHKRLIVFYNHNGELDQLRLLCSDLGVECAERNGHNHDSVPVGKEWIYLCQYNAAAEAWNCITTNAIVFYSLNYSYSTMVQSAGRIDRLNTPYKDLYYYYLKSTSSIDRAIAQALKEKRDFNNSDFKIDR